MFGGSGAPHSHDDTGEKCNCRDATDFIAKLKEAGVRPPEKFIEPERVRFPGWELQEVSGIYVAPCEFIDEYIFYLWSDIRRGVAESGFGPGRITWTDFKHYQEFTGREIPQWARPLIIAFERAFLSAYTPATSEDKK